MIDGRNVTVVKAGCFVDIRRHFGFFVGTCRNFIDRCRQTEAVSPGRRLARRGITWERGLPIVYVSKDILLFCVDYLARLRKSNVSLDNCVFSAFIPSQETPRWVLSAPNHSIIPLLSRSFFLAPTRSCTNLKIIATARSSSYSLPKILPYPRGTKNAISEIF